MKDSNNKEKSTNEAKIEINELNILQTKKKLNKYRKSLKISCKCLSGFAVIAIIFELFSAAYYTIGVIAGITGYLLFFCAVIPLIILQVIFVNYLFDLNPELLMLICDLLDRQLNKEENNTNNNLDNLKKLKELLDSGIITQEEFDAKKKQILGL